MEKTAKAATVPFRILRTLAVFLLAACGSVLGQSLPKQGTDSALAELGAGFFTATVQVNGIMLHYVRGGTGPAVILLHGFPEDWYAYHRVMPRLAREFTVVAVDLPGIGGSTGKPGGYSAADMADDIHQLQEQLHLEHAYVVGHDIGGMVAYAFFRRYPEATRGTMLLDVPVPGLAPWKEITTRPFAWHIHFQQVPDLPEELVAGRQAEYFRYFLDPEFFSDADVARYAESYSAPEHLHAAFEVYRAFSANEKFNVEQQSRIDVPLVLAVGSESSFLKDLPTMSEALRAHGCTNVKTATIQGSSHYVVDERPETVVDIIEKYFYSPLEGGAVSGAHLSKPPVTLSPQLNGTPKPIDVFVVPTGMSSDGVPGPEM
jgi:pimeloyl-ACP methyl ester carboxylesterase